MIESPDALREHVRALAHRLVASASTPAGDLPRPLPDPDVAGAGDG